MYMYNMYYVAKIYVMFFIEILMITVFKLETLSQCHSHIILP